MKQFWLNLWKDDCGALLATEWLVLASIIVIGVVPGLIAVRNGLLHEMKDVANATTSLDQSYEFTGNELVYKDRSAASNRQRGHKSMGNGSITDIVVNGTNRDAGSTTIVRRDVRGTTTDAHDSNRRQPPIARTAGSGFIQGNHTADGRDIQTGTKPAEIKDVQTKPIETAPKAGRD